MRGEWEGQVREKAKSSHKRGCFRGGGRSESDTEGRGQAGEAVSFETLLRDQGEPRRGLRTGLRGCRMFRIHLLPSLLPLLTGVLAAGRRAISTGPMEGSGQVASNSTGKCHNGTHVRAAWPRRVEDFGLLHVMSRFFTRIVC